MLTNIEGFETMATSDAGLRTDIAAKYTTLNTSNMYALAGPKSDRAIELRLGTTYFNLPIPTVNEITVGMRFKYVGTTWSTFRIIDVIGTSGTIEIDVRLASTGEFVFHGPTGASVASTSSLALVTNTWYYLEFRFVRHATAGSITLHKDGTQVFSATSVNTGNTGTGYSIVRMLNTSSGTTVPTFLDDIYTLDTTGSYNTSRIGPKITRLQVPVSDIALDGTLDSGFSDWTRSSGSSNQALIDEVPNDGDSSYIEASAASRKFWVGVGQLAGRSDLSGGAVSGVQVNTVARHTGSAVNFTPNVRVSSSSAAGTARTPTASFAHTNSIFESDPNASAVWTPSTIQSALWGLNT